MPVPPSWTFASKFMSTTFFRHSNSFSSLFQEIASRRQRRIQEDCFLFVERRPGCGVEPGADAADAKRAGRGGVHRSSDSSHGASAAAADQRQQRLVREQRPPAGLRRLHGYGCHTARHQQVGQNSSRPLLLHFRKILPGPPE